MNEKMLVRFVFGGMYILAIPVFAFLALLLVITVVNDCCKYRMTLAEWWDEFIGDDGAMALRELAKMFWYPIRYGEIYTPVLNNKEEAE